MKNTLLTAFLLSTPLAAQINIIQNDFSGKTRARVILGETEPDISKSAAVRTTTNSTFSLESKTDLILRYNSSGEVIGSASAFASISGSSILDAETNTLNFSLTHSVSNTRTGTTIGGLASTTYLDGTTNNHRMRFIVSSPTPYTFGGSLGGTSISGAGQLTLKRLAPTPSTLYFAYNGVPSPTTLSGILTPGEYEIRVQGLNLSVGNNNNSYSRTAIYELDFADPDDPTHPSTITTTPKFPALTKVDTDNTETTLTIDPGTHPGVIIQRSTDLITWTTLASDHPSTTFTDPISPPVVFYRLGIP